MTAIIFVVILADVTRVAYVFNAVDAVVVVTSAGTYSEAVNVASATVVVVSTAVLLCLWPFYLGCCCCHWQQLLFL